MMLRNIYPPPQRRDPGGEAAGSAPPQIPSIETKLREARDLDQRCPLQVGRLTNSQPPRKRRRGNRGGAKICKVMRIQPFERPLTNAYARIEGLNIEIDDAAVRDEVN